MSDVPGFEALQTLDCASCGHRFDIDDPACPQCGARSESGTSEWEEPEHRVARRPRQAAPATSQAAGVTAVAESIDDVLDAAALDEAGATADLGVATGTWRVLGSGLDADIVVPSDRLAPRGVRLRRVGRLVQIRPLAHDVVVTVDGEPRTGEVTVALDRREVRIDGVPLTDSMVPFDTLEADDLPGFFAPILIGRGPECDFRIDDPAVSGRHARLVREPSGLHIEDLDSANGTYIHERRIKRAAIDWRTEFELGTVSMTPMEVVRAVRGLRSATATSIVGAVSDVDVGAGTIPTRGPAVLGPHSGASAALTTGFGTTRGVPVSDEASSGTGVTPLGDLLRPGAQLIVGRDADADIVIDTPNVSRRHARIEVIDRGFRVTDLGSTNGTWVGGERITGPTVVQADADLRIGPHRLSLDLSRGATARDQAGIVGVRLDAHKLVREVGPPGSALRVVDEVSFSILPGEMVAIMGPSGAGKTSVLTSLAGYTPPTTGHVLLDGLSLYRHYDVFRRAIGYVPQDDVMHRTLTVDEILFYHAKINFPSELSDAEIRVRIDTVLRQLDLERVRGTLVGDEVRRGLSGGQRKRLNVAIELLAQPSLLLLDEPTSGLDARSAMQLIRQCRALASGGRTVVMTIHQPRREAFDLFDKILLLTRGGKVAYFGPVTGVKRYFSERSEVPPESARNPADYVLDVLDPLDPQLARSPAVWRDDYLQSPQHSRFVASRLRKDQLAAARKGASRKGVKQENPFRQTLNLTRRYALLKWRDRNALAVQMLQAPVIAALATLLFHQGRFNPVFLKDDITPTLFVIVASAVWFGCSNVAREIVGESAIFRRERMGSLRAGPYLASKIAVQGALITAQVGLLLAILIPVVPLQGSVLGLSAVALVAGWSAMSMGLLISTLARTELQAIQFVPLVILPQIMLSGILLPVTGEKATAAAMWLSKPMLLRWAYGASVQVEYAPTTKRGAEAIQGFVKFWDRIGFGDDRLWTDLIVMDGLGIVCVIISWLILLRRDRR